MNSGKQEPVRLYDRLDESSRRFYDRHVELLRAKVLESPLDETELSEKIGRDETFVSELLEGSQALSYEHVFAILEALEVDFRDFYAELVDDA